MQMIGSYACKETLGASSVFLSGTADGIVTALFAASQIP